MKKKSKAQWKERAIESLVDDLAVKRIDAEAESMLKKINEDKRKPPIWYAAGRIERSRYRFGLVECAVYDYENLIQMPPLVQCEGFTYSGPFTISCDHGCAHMPPVKKAVGLWTCKYDALSKYPYEEARGSVSHGSFPSFCTGYDTYARSTFSRAMFGIEKADCVFAWLNSEECFGTLVEIGYAYGLKKKIYLAHPSHVNPHGEMWFAFESATYIMQTEDPQRAWLEAIAIESMPCP